MEANLGHKIIALNKRGASGSCCQTREEGVKETKGVTRKKENFYKWGYGQIRCNCGSGESG